MYVLFCFCSTGAVRANFKNFHGLKQKVLSITEILTSTNKELFPISYFTYRFYAKQFWH